ncbi:MAG: hypothetical protein HC919_03700 [Oscillatoriales cyanobacterium SM2_2_1]|nr:hypothetical protein [Oscillatoriales cyanobacterium SM2_2_1]
MKNPLQRTWQQARHQIKSQWRKQQERLADQLEELDSWAIDIVNDALERTDAQIQELPEKVKHQVAAATPKIKKTVQKTGDQLQSQVKKTARQVWRQLRER